MLVAVDDVQPLAAQRRRQLADRRLAGARLADQQTGLAVVQTPAAKGCRARLTLPSRALCCKSVPFVCGRLPSFLQEIHSCISFQSGRISDLLLCERTAEQFDS